MSAPPLTHHEILKLIEPFTRAGRHVDLAACDRPARRLTFRPIEHGGESAELPALRESLVLHSFGTGTHVLTRTLSLENGVTATLEAIGLLPDDLLARVNSVAPRQHFQFGAGYVIARSYALQGGTAAAAQPSGTAAARRTLTHASVQVDGLVLTLGLSAVRGVSADIALQPTRGELLDIPEDLLAVLGWDWARLIRTSHGWKTRLRLRGDAARRTDSAERALERAAVHLARTLAEPPARFHERWRVQRWGVVFRRAIPLLTFLALLVAVATLARAAAREGPRLWMFFFQVPTALIALSFCMQELPQYEIPPWPRRHAARSWRVTV